jgi:hypothetical protein
MKKKKLSGWRWVVAILSMLTVICVASLVGIGNVGVAAAAAKVKGKKVTVWLQVTDSCKQALLGATFTVTGPGINSTTAATTGGAKPQSLPGYINGQCPIQQGTCINFPTGCTSTTLNVPISGTAVYKFTVAKTAPAYGTNLRYAICNGGSACPYGPEVATVNVASSGSVSATVLNYYPDGTTVIWPTDKSAYNGSRGDPVLFHEYGIGNGSISCDYDHDADDYLTGTPNRHCDSDPGSVEDKVSTVSNNSSAFLTLQQG